MKLSNSAPYSLFFLSSILGLSYAAGGSSHLNDESPCVAHSPASGLYYDLNPISLSPPEMKNGKKISPDDRDESWTAKGHDYPANFTLNVCAPVMENFTTVEGVPSSRWSNISAFYEQHGKIYSMGEQASEPFFRGRKLVLNYTNGSPCTDDYNGAGSNASIRTKSTLMSFLCDRDAPQNQATVSFVGTMDSCSYYFEVRSSAACGGIAVDPNSGGMGPAGVFGVIMLIAVAVYLVGGCAYQRTVMHQRGWRQCPNFSLWAGMFDFVKDMFIIVFSSLGNCLRLRGSPSREGYTRAGSDSRGGFIGAIGGRRGGGSGGRGDVDAENRLIDQLDEEWDD
ncbi:Vacuolar sorting receptor (Mrl1) [Penicillium angulare]|uniref:Vacuolar sorting receptor (Mrl1) n=1 Tax=Penicillium angulare TaxID=116970 RepID=UPI0025415CFD|nr:Vacuolar sorting receptor (Mrl1) [Penicillium angulare]KAJ5279013.1 Vacuolar sorting receptor (Mrl1) [Penicillium angulare]